MRARTLAFLILIASLAPAQEERVWLTMPIERLASLSDSLAFNTGKLDTVWRDTLIAEKNPRYTKPEKPADPKEQPVGEIGKDEKPLEQAEPEFLMVSQRIRKAVPRMAGGYVVAKVTAIDTLHTLATVMVYSSKQTIDRLTADKGIVLIERVADRLDTTTTYTWKRTGRRDTVSYSDTLHLEFPVKKDTIVTRRAVNIVRDSLRVPVYTVKKVPTVDERGSLPTKEQADTKALFTTWGVKATAVNAAKWTTYEEKKASTMTILKVQRKDLEGSEVSLGRK